jgi:hypothetical protein
MTAGMPSKTTGTKAEGKGGNKGARNRVARRAVKPAAKATWFVGKKVAKRKARKHARRYGDAARTAWSAALIYGPMAAEVLGAVEPPKPRRRFPAFLAGMAVGGGVMYLAGRDRTA